MFDLVDIHCHALFGVDDGADNEVTMKSMLDIAYNDGIRVICFTPHFKTYEFRSEKDISSYNNSILESFKIATEYAKKNLKGMALYLGSEIMCHNEIFDSLNSDACRSLNNGSYILIEFPLSATAYDIENTVARILRKGYKPVIAHIERYSALYKKPELISELRNMGALMQVNARSFTSFKFGKIRRFIKLLLKKRLIDIVATDSHDDSFYKPNFSKALPCVIKACGEKYAEKIFSKNAMSILSNEK